MADTTSKTFAENVNHVAELDNSLGYELALRRSNIVLNENVTYSALTEVRLFNRTTNMTEMVSVPSASVTATGLNAYLGTVKTALETAYPSCVMTHSVTQTVSALGTFNNLQLAVVLSGNDYYLRSINVKISEADGVQYDLDGQLVSPLEITPKLLSVSAGTLLAIDSLVGNEANINAVVANEANINTLVDSLANVNTIASIQNLANMTTVANDLNSMDLNGIADVTVVANNLVLGAASSINIVSADKANIDAVAANKTNIDAVAANEANINAVAGSAAEVAANVLLTHADVALTHADVVLTNADVLSADASADIATTQAEIATTKASESLVSATAADASKIAAAASELSASSSASTATTKASEASASATEADLSATAATTKAGEASVSAVNAATSESNASTSESNALASANTAADQAGIATTKASEANASATNAGNSATSASTSASNAATSASTATTKAAEASASASAASGSAIAAAASESNSANSATNSANSATAASLSAAEAATFATSATTKANEATASAVSASTFASNAANSATLADASANAAASSATEAASLLDQFDDRYLGPKASDPLTDNDGNTLLVGALYYNTGTNTLRIWTGNVWNAAAFDATGAVISFNTRVGAVTLLSTDVTAALGYTPEPANANIQTHISSTTNPHNTTATQVGAYTTSEVDTLLAGKSDITHNHDGVYEPADATIVKEATIDVLTNKTIDSMTNKVGADHVHLKVKNMTGVTLTKGTLVKIVSFEAGEETIRVAPITSNSEVAIGILHTDILHGEVGLAVNTGVETGIDTTAYVVGTPLYVGATGLLTSTKPTTGPVQAVAMVLRQANDGTMLVEFTEPSYYNSYYTKTEVDTALSNKSDTTHTHTGVYEPANVNIQSHISSTSNPHSVTAGQVGAYTTTQVDTLLSVKSDIGHTHAVATTAADGFMSSTDKTKLDGIEAGATADMTAAEILAAIKTVDGSTSGLDADLLDGLDSTAFAAAGHIHTLDNLSDVAVTTPTTGQVLSYNGTQWVNSAPTGGSGSIDETVSHLSITATTYNTDGTLATMTYTGGYKTLYAYSSGNLSTVQYTDTDGTTVLLTETIAYSGGNIATVTRS